MKRPTGLPFVSVNVATTADGKIAPANRKFVPFSSARDQELMLELRAEADAVMCGARTIDLAKVSLGPGGKKYRDLRRRRGLAESNLRVIVSGNASLDPAAEIFRHRFSPIIVLTGGKAPASRVRRLRQVADAVESFGEADFDPMAAMRWLRSEWGVKKLLCEGGGGLNGLLFRAGLVDQVYLTVCPVIFGGREAPTLADGAGAGTLSEAVRLRLKKMRRGGDEMFLVYAVVRGGKAEQ